MAPKIYIGTDRLLLRAWKEEDKTAFAEMNANENVMRYFPSCLSNEQSDALAEVIKAEFEEFNMGLFAVELKSTGEFIGFVGFHHFSFDVPFSPGWEIGWRISDRHWLRGYASEAANACLEYARSNQLFDTLYSFTSVHNRASECVMKSIGMTRTDTFQHPALPEGHLLKEHVLYKIDLK